MSAFATLLAVLDDFGCKLPLQGVINVNKGLCYDDIWSRVVDYEVTIEDIEESLFNIAYCIANLADFKGFLLIFHGISSLVAYLPVMMA